MLLLLHSCIEAIEGGDSASQRSVLHWSEVGGHHWLVKSPPTRASLPKLIFIIQSLSQGGAARGWKRTDFIIFIFISKISFEGLCPYEDIQKNYLPRLNIQNSDLQQGFILLVRKYILYSLYPMNCRFGAFVAKMSFLFHIRWVKTIFLRYDFFEKLGQSRPTAGKA